MHRFISEVCQDNAKNYGHETVLQKHLSFNKHTECYFAKMSS